MPFTSVYQNSRKLDLKGIRDIQANIYSNGLKYVGEFKADLVEAEWPTPDCVEPADVVAFDALKATLQTALGTVYATLLEMEDLLKV